MSLCPHCQGELSLPDFCDGCFRLLRSSHPGRFEAVLLDQVLPEPQAAPQTKQIGPDLREVQFRPSSWSTRVLRPLLGKFALATLAAVLLGLGWLLVRGNLKTEAHQHLTQARKDLSKDSSQARSQAELALDLARQSKDPSLLAEVLAFQGEIAFSQGAWQEAIDHWQQAQSQQPFPTLQEKITVARARLLQDNRKRAGQLLKEAEKLIPRGKDAEVLKLTARALQLVQTPIGPEAAQAHYLNATVFRRMKLTEECRQQLQFALKADRSHSKSRDLLASLPPPPPPPREYHFAPVPRPGSRYQYRPPNDPVSFPASQPVTAPPAAQVQLPAPSYPTYSRPEPSSSLAR